MEILGVSSTFRLPFFFLPNNNKLAFRRLPPPPTAFRSLPPPYLSHAPPPQRLGNRRLAVPYAVRPAPPASVANEARAILRDFLEEHGTGSALEERKALEIVELLSPKLRSLHESEQQLGVQLQVPQLMDLFTPYLRSILKEYDDDTRIIEEDGKLLSAPPGREKMPDEAPWIRRKRDAIAQLEMQLSEGCPPLPVLSLMNLGLDLCQVLSMVRKCHFLATASIKQKLEHMIKFLISLGISESRVPQILRKCPVLLRLSIEENIIPSMALLESKGVDKAQWPMIMNLCPGVLLVGKAKVVAVVGYFSQMGLSPVEIGRMLTCSPLVLCSSLEAKIKPMIRFLLDIGFSMEEVHLIFLNPWSPIYGLDLEQNLKPKWDFLLRVGYTRLDLLKYPAYFSHSLEKRIKPRFERATKLGIHWSLSSLLVPTNKKFEDKIKKRMLRMQKGHD